jgi:UDP-N-acetylmuramate--alanine ligase
MKYSVKSILFLGIGGISMHQLATCLKNLGVKVVGYDVKQSKYTKLCEEKNIKVFHKFSKELFNVDLCVKTGAIQNGKILNNLKKRNIPILDRAEILGWLSRQFKNVIAVAGTHGKSTTASLIYEILKSAGKKVSCHIGAEVKNSQFKIGDDFLVVEACEFNKSFLKLNPTISVVTNIEKEHMDSYNSMFDLKNSFWSFLKKAETKFVFSESSTRFLNKYKNINFVDKLELNLQTKLKGDYNLKNISLAVAVCEYLNVDNSVIKNVIQNFVGVPRRYEYIGKFQDSDLFLDYAHHPTEVKCFVETFVSEHKNNQIVFQPHTFSRTKTFFKEFIKIFSKVENLIIYKEYSARETPQQGLSAKELFLEVKKHNVNVKYCNNFKTLKNEIFCNSNIAFVGAGDINLLAEKLIKKE